MRPIGLDGRAWWVEGLKGMWDEGPSLEVEVGKKFVKLEIYLELGPIRGVYYR